MNAETAESHTVHELTAWFRDKLDHSNMHWEDEPQSYDGNTPYDILFYRLQKEAAQYWQDHYGFVPTPAQLTNAFFGAEFERARQRRLVGQTWRRKLHHWYSHA